MRGNTYVPIVLLAPIARRPRCPLPARKATVAAAPREAAAGAGDGFGATLLKLLDRALSR
jgi:hypothetical protein